MPPSCPQAVAAESWFPPGPQGRCGGPAMVEAQPGRYAVPKAAQPRRQALPEAAQPGRQAVPEAAQPGRQAVPEAAQPRR